MERSWSPRLSAAAETDLREIIRWTTRQFGAAQARSYRQTILSAIRALENGPEAPGSKARDEIMPGVRTLHVARNGRRGRHFLIYKTSGSSIVILRVLHDSMELARHLPGESAARSEAAMRKTRSD